MARGQGGSLLLPCTTLSFATPCRFYPGASQIGQRSLDSPIAPTAVFFCHTHNQSLDLLWLSRSAASPLAAAVVFLRDQPAMPGQEGLGSDHGSHPLEKLPSQSLGLGIQSAALLIVELYSL